MGNTAWCALSSLTFHLYIVLIFVSDFGRFLSSRLASSSGSHFITGIPPKTIGIKKYICVCVCIIFFTGENAFSHILTQCKIDMIARAPSSSFMSKHGWSRYLWEYKITYVALWPSLTSREFGVAWHSSFFSVHVR